MTKQFRYRTPEEAFSARTEQAGECTIWTGARSKAGYGQLRVAGRAVYAHRFAYERTHGPIPEGMVVDHICHTPACVNAAHLRLATHRQNIANRSGAQRGRTQDLPRGVVQHGARYRARAAWKSLGVFATPGEASLAAEAGRRAAYGEYAGGSE